MRLLRLLGIFLLIFMNFYACKKEESLSPDKGSQPLLEPFLGRTEKPATFFAFINGNRFEAQAIRGTIEEESIFFGRSIRIEALREDQSFFINIENYEQGEYLTNLNPLFNSMDYQADSSFYSFGTFYAGNSSDGKITLDGFSSSTRISGEFSGTLSDITGDRIVEVVRGEFENIILEPPGFSFMEWDQNIVPNKSSDCFFSQDFINNRVVDVITSWSNDSTYQMRLTFHNKIREGRVDIDSVNVEATITNLDDGEVFSSKNGFVRITSVSSLLKEARGRFEFVATSTSSSRALLIENGRFKAIAP